jgi:Zn finger protein HypA/HybF involved in hydrogenase expression
MNASFLCPSCNKRLTLNFNTSEVYCPACGYVRPDEISQLDEKQAEVKGLRPRPSVKVLFKGTLMPAALAAFESGQAALYHGERTAALSHFQRAADLQHDFVDAHFWISEVTADPALKRDKLHTVLALMPQHLDALRRKMELEGDLSPEEAARLSTGHEPKVQNADGVRTLTRSLLCPQCGGRLTVGKQNVFCIHCGYAGVHTPEAATQPKALVRGLLKRRAKAVRWEVGSRLIHCNQCGAESVLGGLLSLRCRFCGATQVILQDALGSFSQPEGIIPFKLDEDDARDQIMRQLNSFSELAANLINTNRPRTIALEAVFLPFWIFDCTVDVIQTHTTRLASEGGTTTTVTSDFLDDVAICAAKSPPRQVVYRLSRYDLRELTAYDPVLLARTPAQLYSIDVDAASIEAREIVADVMRRKHNREVDRDYDRDSRDGRVNRLRTQAGPIRAMDYQLVLLPMWIAQITEVDADQRLALVNGQTGHVCFGQTVRVRN